MNSKERKVNVINLQRVVTLNVSMANVSVSLDKKQLAEHIMCYLATTYFPELCFYLMLDLDITKVEMYKQSRSLRARYIKNAELRKVVAAIRKELMPEGYSEYYITEKTSDDVESPTKRLFGFDYTLGEIAHRRAAIVSAVKFMKENYN